MSIINVNGYRVFHLQTDNPIVNARVIVNAGAADETADAYGVAHFLEHMFFKGTEKHSYKEINQITSELGDINAYTSRFQTCYHFTFLAEDFVPAIGILFEMTFQPAFPEDEFEKEKGVIKEECQSVLDSPRGFFSERYTEDLLGTSVGHSIIGNLESIADMTPKKMRLFIKQFYNPANILIAVVGNVSLEQVVDAVTQLPIQKDFAEVERTTPALNLEDNTFHHPSKQAVIALTTKGICTRQEIELGYLPDIFFNGFGGGMHSILFDRLREELGLCYSVHGWHGSADDYGFGVIHVMLNEEQVPLALEEIKKLIAQVNEQGLNDSLLRISKKNYLFGFGRRLQTSNGINNHADDFFALDGYDLIKYINFDERRKMVAAITNDDIIAFSRKIFGEGTTLKTTVMTQEPINQEPDGV